LLGKLPSNSIPQINFVSHCDESAEPFKILKKCLINYNYSFYNFIDWLLYNLGDPDIKSIERNSYWEENFNLKPFLESPGDWIGHYFECYVASKGIKDSTGFFSTPISLCLMMVKMLNIGSTDSVYEPCAGTGRMLMAASNYSVNLFAQEINLTLIKICKINAWLYMPWLIMPLKNMEVNNQFNLDRKLLLKIWRENGNKSNTRHCTSQNDQN
jgi:hypothetical protein